MMRTAGGYYACTVGRPTLRLLLPFCSVRSYGISTRRASSNSIGLTRKMAVVTQSICERMISLATSARNRVSTRRSAKSEVLSHVQARLACFITAQILDLTSLPDQSTVSGVSLLKARVRLRDLFFVRQEGALTPWAWCMIQALGRPSRLTRPLVAMLSLNTSSCPAKWLSRIARTWPMANFSLLPWHVCSSRSIFLSPNSSSTSWCRCSSQCNSQLRSLYQKAWGLVRVVSATRTKSLCFHPMTRTDWTY